MLVKLLPSQVGHYWDLLAPWIEAGLPPTTYGSDKRMTYILKDLMSNDNIQCWMITASPQVNGSSIMGVVITRVVDGGPTLIRNLEIYCMYAFKPISEDLWKEGFETLRKFARHKGCYRIIAYSDNVRVIDIVDKLGGSSNYRFITLEVDSD